MLAQKAWRMIRTLIIHLPGLRSPFNGPWPLPFISSVPFSVVVLGKFRRFLLVIFLSLFLHLDFSFIYSKFSMPFWGFFY